MEQSINKITINGVEYVAKNSLNKKAESLNGLPLVMIRTYSAGVHFGYLKSQKEKVVELLNSRRVWYWAGAASISQLSVDGTSRPSDCKFACEVESIILTEAIEIIPITEKAATNLKSVKVWKV